MLNYNEMSKEMLIAHIQTMDMQLEAFTESEYKRRIRIAELEHQLQDHSAQAFSIGETYANALSRIAELEAQIAAASASAVEQQPVAYAIFATYEGIHRFCHAHLDRQSADKQASCFATERKAEVLPLYATPQAADTDKLREFVEAVATSYSGFDNQERLYCYGCEADLDDHEPHKPDCIVLRAQAALASTALQAPVREVPGWKLVPLEVTDAMLEAWKNELCIPVGSSPEAKARRAYKAMLAAAPLPADPVQPGESK